jgi:hypothetical protein
VVNAHHWSRRITASNPHGFQESTLERLRAITDPVLRAEEEERALTIRNLQQQNRSAMATVRLHEKIQAGYVEDDYLFFLQFSFFL